MTDSKPMNRDSHLPPPEVCDWLLSQDWSGVIPITVITYPEGNPDGISKSERFDHASAGIAIGSDDIADVFMPAEALEMLRADQVARNRALNEKRRKCQADEEARKSAWRASRECELAVPPESTQPLSPAAQAVLAAYGNEIGGIDAIMGSERRGLAAALRAVAVNGGIKTLGGGFIFDCRSLLAIAAELEAQP